MRKNDFVCATGCGIWTRPENSNGITADKTLIEFFVK